VSWPPNEGALVEGRPTYALKATFHPFQRMFPLSPKRKREFEEESVSFHEECGGMREFE
jgi:hypothetical protein